METNNKAPVGRFAIEYPTTVPGMSHSMALTYGRLAGMNAAKGI